MVFIKVKPCSTRPAFPLAVLPPASPFRSSLSYPCPLFLILFFFLLFLIPLLAPLLRDVRHGDEGVGKTSAKEKPPGDSSLARKKTRKGEREVGSTLLISEWPSRAATVVALRREIDDGSRVSDAVTFRVHSSRSSDFRLCTTSGRLTITLVKRDSFFSLRAIGERNMSIKSVADTLATLLVEDEWFRWTLNAGSLRRFYETCQ